MHSDKSGDAAKRLNVRLTGVTLMLAVSILANGALAIAAVTSRQVVLVPTLPAQTVLAEGAKVPFDYLETVSRDAAYLFLNRTPENGEYFEQQLLKIAEPTTYQAIRNALLDERRTLREQRLSQTFYPLDWYIDPANLYVEVQGNLQKSNGTQVLSTDPKTYAMRFKRRGAGILLASMTEIDPKEAKGPSNKAVANQEPL